jgi:transposase
VRSNIPAGQKEAILKKVLNRGTKSISQIAREEGVDRKTISSWAQEHAKPNGMNTLKGTDAKNELVNIQKKLVYVKEYFSLPEDKRGEYLRTQGLKLSQIENWIQNPRSFLGTEAIPKKEAQELKQRLKEKEKECLHNEKALAKAAALLILKKKMNFLIEDEAE